MQNSHLVSKYNVPGPRYTSYPTVPFWNNLNINESNWKVELKKADTQSIAIYIHLPYCESLCTFCGCHKRITKNHKVETPYIDALIQEWEIYKNLLVHDFQIQEIHLGGGTPTFFGIDEILRLMKAFKPFLVKKNCELSFEAHPSNTTKAHLKELHSIGFNRVSFGIQDYDPVVQKAIHRIQSFESVQKIHNQAKELGYTSINHDLVYGLPFQNKEGFLNTLLQTLQLKPERIALYSYAHVPWIKGTGQRGYSEENLPNELEKMQLYEMATEFLLNHGYVSIGMDHFALPNDSLTTAFNDKTLHRNFMGYTTKPSSTLIGLGMSAISDSWGAFAQNEKNVEVYLDLVNKGILPIHKGHILTDLELITRKQILDLMCQFETILPYHQENREEIINQLKPLVADDLVVIVDEKVMVPIQGRGFIRNICMAFDFHLHNFEIGNQMFSKTI